jgi:hypothetical protein
MSALWGSLGVAVSFALLYALRFVDSHLPDYFNVVVALLTLLFMVVVHFTDFRRDNQTDASFVRGVLNGEDIKASLLDPLYYTFKTKSLRYKSSKFGVLDDLNDQMRSVAGETSIIGEHVKIYQGVTIGALSTRGGQRLRGNKRHPTIEDDVTIYAGASVLGGETVIGRGSVVGANVFITKSISPGTRVGIKTQELVVSNREESKKPHVETVPNEDNTDDGWYYII